MATNTCKINTIICMCKNENCLTYLCIIKLMAKSLTQTIKCIVRARKNILTILQFSTL